MKYRFSKSPQTNLRRAAGKLLVPILATLAFGVWSPAASAQVMLSPADVIGTDLGTFSSDVPLTNMINHSGVTTQFVSGVTLFDSYFENPGQTFATNNYLYNWQSDFSFDLPLRGYVDFDLGATYTINKMAIWNVSVSNLLVRIADTPAGLPTGQVLGNFSLPNHLNNPFSYEVNILDFGTNRQARYVRLQINSAYEFSPGDGFAYAIIGEVVMSAIPGAEPPVVNMSRDPNGDVRLTFTGTLQSSTNAAGIYTDVSGNPQDTYVIPKANQSARQFFRVREN
jgi:hypothetical protein